jgi:Flp pilus assembly protein TadD
MKALKWLITVLWLTAAPSTADQNNPALVALFERLATADEDEGRDLTRKIWAVWHESDDPVVSEMLVNGVALMQAGLLSYALEVFDELVEHAPSFAEGWNKRATVLYLLDRNDEAAADIGRTLELEPRHFGALSGLGLIRTESGDYAGALETFLKAREINPHLPGIEENIDRTRSLIKQHTI